MESKIKIFSPSESSESSHYSQSMQEEEEDKAENEKGKEELTLYSKAENCYYKPLLLHRIALSLSQLNQIFHIVQL